MSVKDEAQLERRGGLPRAGSNAGVSGDRSGSVRLFRVLGIDVWLHWSWLMVAVVEIQQRRGAYASQLWNILEYLTLFVIVLLHEFGHALACRSVGGRAEQILLWPMGGIAYVDPPRRPGAQLWSIAAGPLVNVVLLAGALGGMVLVRMASVPLPEDVHDYLQAVVFINVGLLIFNLAPIYPLDGGKILRSLLWFLLGEARSLQIASGIGLIGAAGFLMLAVLRESIWWILTAVYAGMQSWQAFEGTRRYFRFMAQLRAAPAHVGIQCPSCHRAPPMGAYWSCPCGAGFDTFAVHGRCPNCGRSFEATSCLLCHEASPLAEWMTPTPSGPAA